MIKISKVALCGLIIGAILAAALMQTKTGTLIAVGQTLGILGVFICGKNADD